jgi:hypothetical protein
MLGELRPGQYGTTAGLWHLNGNSTDSSGNGNNGTDTAITYSQANGKFGQGAGFNRSSSTIAIADNASLDFDGSTSFSMVFWMKRNGIPSTNPDHIINKYSGSASPGYYVRCETTTGYPYLVIYGASSSQTEVLGSKDVCDNVWHQIASVRSIADDKAYLFIDGCLNNSATDATTGSSANGNSLYFGSYNGSSLWYGGSLEEVMITPTALTANQIRQIYALGVGKYY